MSSLSSSFSALSFLRLFVTCLSSFLLLFCERSCLPPRATDGTDGQQPTEGDHFRVFVSTFMNGGGLRITCAFSTAGVGTGGYNADA